MPRDASYIYHVPPGTDGIPDTVIESNRYNIFIHDVENDLNYPRPIVAGGTGASTAVNARAALTVPISMQVVANYASHAWENGYFSSDTTVIDSPVPGDAFVGYAYFSDINNGFLEARDLSQTVEPGLQYVRELKAGVWSPWVQVSGGGGGSGGISDAPYDGTPYARQNYAWVSLFGTANPVMDGIAAPGVAITSARIDHVHPSDTSRAPLVSPAFTGVPTTPTPAPTDNSTTLANTQYVTAAVAASAASDAATYAPLASPHLTGVPTAPTPATADSSTTLATTAYVKAQGYLIGNQTITFTGDVTGSGATAVTLTIKPSVALTGSPTTPNVTPATDSSTKIANTAFVQSAIATLPAIAPPSNTNPNMDGTAAPGVGLTYSRFDHVHPTDTSRAPNVVFGASGASHAQGLVPDPGATAGATRFLREDGAWQTPAGGTGGGASVTISDTAPASPSAGNLWWESDTGILYIYYTDVNSSQWVIAAPMPDTSTLVRYDQAQSLTIGQQAQAQSNIGVMPPGASDYSNILVNGQMEIDQINLAAALTNVAAGYVIDGWQISKVGTSVINSQLVADAPPGFANSLKFSVTTGEASLAAGDYCQMFQPVEGVRTAKLQWGTANAQPVVLSFWSKIHRPGLYSGNIKNPGATRTFVFTFTQNAADTWEYKTVAVPGDVTGAWPGYVTTAGISVQFCMATGTTYQAAAGWNAGSFLGATGTTNGVAATTDVFQIAGVSLVTGLIAPTQVQSPLVKRSYNDELVLCRRYWWCSDPLTPKGMTTGGKLSGYSLAAGYLQISTIRFTVPMRAVPTMTVWSAGVQGNVRNATSGAAITAGAISNAYASTEGYCILGAASVPVSTWIDYDAWADARL